MESNKIDEKFNKTPILFKFNDKKKEKIIIGIVKSIINLLIYKDLTILFIKIAKHNNINIKLIKNMSQTINKYSSKNNPFNKFIIF